ncbi:MAG: hypothetical protein SFZ23_02155 [Planctomycetota bacterium]|nr:hypothetical protein [Planctomycetota bacterium]
MTRDVRTQLMAVIVLIACLLTSGYFAVQASASAGRSRLTYTDRADEGTPPQVALGIAMGAFRGVFVNFLWIRANAQKEAGRLFEAIELSNAITKLQPRFPRVWIFHAWNIAYNISVATQTRDERWQWVNAGIRILRDGGIPANPNDILLHKELAWIFLHKIQGYTDDANNYYKVRLAEEWQSLLGTPPPMQPGKRSRADAIERYASWIRPIVDAPSTLDELYQREPSTRALVDQLRTTMSGQEPDLRLIRRVMLLQALDRSGRKGFIEPNLGPNFRALREAMADPAHAKAWPLLIATVQRRVLVEQYNMEPARMLRYVEKFGPIDWRHPAAHSLYWSHRGSEEARTRRTERNSREFDFVNTDRVTIHSVQELWRSGDIYFDYIAAASSREAFYMAAPNFHFVDTYGDLIEEVASNSDLFEDPTKRAWTSYGAGYENFLRDAVRTFYRRGEREVAEKYLQRLRTNPYMTLNDPDRARDLADLDEFVRKELSDRYSSPDVALQEAYGGLMDAYVGGLLGGDDESFRNGMRYAAEVHKYYFEEQFRQTIADRSRARMEKMPREFPVFAGAIFAAVMQGLGPDEAELMYARAPDDLRRFAYDELKASLETTYTENQKVGGRAFAVVFPEPAGMAEHRVRVEQLRAERDAQSNTPVEQQ